MTYSTYVISLLIGDITYIWVLCAAKYVIVTEYRKKKSQTQDEFGEIVPRE